MRLRRPPGRRPVIDRMVDLALGRNCGRLIIDLKAAHNRLLPNITEFRGMFLFLFAFTFFLSPALRLRLFVFIYESFDFVILFQIPNNAIYI
jgi:hypothetical protein